MVYLFRGRRKRLLLLGLISILYLWSLMSPNRWFTRVRYSLHLPSCEQNNNGLVYTQFSDHRPQSQPTQTTLTRPHNETGSSDARTEIRMDNEDESLSRIYRNKWVGFSEILGYNCSEALFSRTQNDHFPMTVARIRNQRFVSDSQNCTDFRRNYGFNRYPDVSEEEMTFPIAFIILFHGNLDQVIFLLRAIYRPHNVYCLSVDANAGDKLLQPVKSVARCLPNVFVASKLERVVYAGFTRLMADIDCMVDLLKHPDPWKYVINMPGQQFPLRTNLELVKILKLLNGSNNIDASEEKWTSVKNRHFYKHIYRLNNITGKLEPELTSERNPRPPYRMKIVKGSTYASFSRAFVQFAVNHPIAHEFLEWNKNVLSPDEYFWSTLQHTGIVNVPGGVFDKPSRVPYITSFSVWKVNNWTCATRFVRKICILSPEDLRHLAKQTSLFANKFYMDHHPAALHCLDEWLVNRTFAGEVLDLSVYNTG